MAEFEITTGPPNHNCLLSVWMIGDKEDTWQFELDRLTLNDWVRSLNSRWTIPIAPSPGTPFVVLQAHNINGYQIEEMI